MSDRSEEISRVVKKARLIRLFFHFFAPATIIMVANIQHKYGAYSSSKQEVHHLGPEFLPYLFIAVSLIGILQAIYFVRKRPNGIIKNLVKSESLSLKFFMGKQSSANARRAVTFILIISVLYEACASYGLFLAILGHDFNWIFLFVAMTVAGYFLYKPDREFFERLYECFDELEGKSSA